MKKWIALLLALTLCLAMFGCGESQADNSTPGTSASTNSTQASTTQPTTAPTEASTTEPTTAPTESTAPQKVNSFSNLKLKLGDQMPDCRLRDVNNNYYNLYELLEEKQMLLINFWFIDCPYCVEEFPFINSAYGQYADSVSVLAINPFDEDDAIISFGQEMNLDFTLLGMDLGMRFAFGVQGYPTSVVIDRNGVIALIHIGAVPDEAVFLNMFEYFTAEDYETVVLEDISQFEETAE